MNILLCQHGGSGNHGCEALPARPNCCFEKPFPMPI